MVTCPCCIASLFLLHNLSDFEINYVAIWLLSIKIYLRAYVYCFELDADSIISETRSENSAEFTT